MELVLAFVRWLAHCLPLAPWLAHCLVLAQFSLLEHCLQPALEVMHSVDPFVDCVVLVVAVADHIDASFALDGSTEHFGLGAREWDWVADIDCLDVVADIGEEAHGIVVDWVVDIVLVDVADIELVVDTAVADRDIVAMLELHLDDNSEESRWDVELDNDPVTLKVSLNSTI